MALRSSLLRLVLLLPLLFTGSCAREPDSPQQTAQGDDWKPLWNGRDLSEWEVVGAGDWRAENGIITVRREPGVTGGGWLVTRGEYADFKLRFRFQWDAARGNSGILIRDPGHARVGRPAFNGFEVQIYEGRGDGEKNPTGSIYDVARAYPSKMDPSRWTEFQIDSVGSHVVTYMDGEKMAETHSRRSFQGAIGLQLHGGSDPEEYRWRDLEIMELPQGPRPTHLMEELAEGTPGEFVDLLSGRNLEDDFEFYWEGGARWELNNGVLRGENPHEISWLFLKEDFGNFVLAFDFRISTGGNGGVCIRFPWPKDGARDRGPAFLGFECQIGDLGGMNPTGSIYNLARAFDTDPSGRQVHRDQTWNQYRVYARGDHIVSYVNRVKMAETHSDRSFRGRIGFQAHEPTEWVEYRNVRIKILP